MKIGDRVYCIKSIQDSSFFSTDYWFIKNRYYTIKNIEKVSRYDYAIIKGEKTVRGDSLSFNLDKKSNQYSFSTYFINITEQRKLKLENLNVYDQIHISINETI